MGGMERWSEGGVMGSSLNCVGVFKEGDNFVGETALVFGEFLADSFEVGAEFGADLVDFFVNARRADRGGFGLGFAVLLHFVAEVGDVILEVVDALGEGVLGVFELFDRREAGPRFAAFEEVVDLIDGDAKRGEADDEPADGFIRGGRHI